MAVGLAAWRLGAGRARKEDPVQAGAGVEMHAKPGDTVTEGQPLLTLHTDEPERFERALAALDGGVVVADGGVVVRRDAAGDRPDRGELAESDRVGRFRGSGPVLAGSGEGERVRLSLTLVDGRTGRAGRLRSSTSTRDQPVGDLVQPLAGLLGEPGARQLRPADPGVGRRRRGGPATARRGSPASARRRGRPSSSPPTGWPAGRRPGWPSSGWCRVPAPGRIHRLPLGETVVGCGAPGWSLPDLRLPSRRAAVSGRPGRVGAVTAPGPRSAARTRRAARRAGG